MANQKLNTTITIGAVLGTKTSRTFGVLKGGLSQINTSIKEVTRRQKEIGRERTALLKAGQSVAHLDREYEKLEDQLKQLTAQQNRWTRAIRRTKEVGRTFGQMRTQLVGTFRAGALAATIYGGAVFGVAKSTAELGDNIAKTADSLGIGTDALQELRYAAERSGVSTDGLDKSLEQYVKRLGEAQAGTGPTADALKQLGLSATDLAKVPLEEQLAIIADRMQGVEDQSVKAALANDLFSRNGVALLNMLKDGSAGLTQLREDARKTGYVMSEEAARQSEAFNDALLDAELSAKGVKNTIGAALLPVTTGLMKQFSSWVQTNSSQIRTWGNSFGQFAERALPVLKDVVTGIGQISGKVWGTISLVSQMVGGWQNFGMIIGGVFAAKTLLSVGAFVGSVFKLGGALLSITKFMPLVAGGIRAIGVAMAANPIGIVITAIAGGAYLIYRNWEGISAWFSRKWSQVKAAFSKAWAGIKSIFLNYTPHGLIIKHWDSISTWFSGLWDRVKSATSSAWAGIKSTFLNYTPHGLIITHWDSIDAWFAGLWDRVKSGVSIGWGAIKSTILTYHPAALIFNNWGSISNWFAQKWNAVKSTFSSAWASIKSNLATYTPARLITQAWGSVSGWFTGLWSRVKAGISQAWNGIKTTLATYGPSALIHAQWQGIATWFGQKWDQVKTTFTSKWASIKASTVSWATDFLAIGGNIIDGLKNGISAKVETAVAAVRNVGSRIVSTFKSLLGINSPSTVFADFGGWIMDGLKNGILAKIEALRATITSVASGAKSWFKSILGINSPSTVFSEFGGWIMDGLKNGIMAKFNELRDAITGIASSAASWFKDKLGINSPSRVFMGFGNNVSEGLAIGIRAKENRVLSSVSGLNASVTSGFGNPALNFTPRVSDFAGVPANVNDYERLAIRETSNRAPSTAANPPNHHTENHIYHINVQAASGQQAQEIWQEIERKKNTARGGRLFDQNSLRVG